MSRRQLIVNADDFGLSPGVNRGIVEAHERGIVTRTSLMTRGRAAREAVELARSTPDLEVGLHIDMGEWTFRNGTWVALYEVVDLRDARAVAAELEDQLSAFRHIVGRNPTHLDSHQHVHRHEPLTSIASEVAQRLGIPLRQSGPARYCGEFYGQDDRGEPWPAQLSVESLSSIARRLPEGLSELCCHPGFVDDALMRTGTMYCDEREIELRSLCDPCVRPTLADLGIELVTTDYAPVENSAR
jgi:predicted glycoside hydrolase/deacetylase ChbG (UPF0249 family)